MVPIFLVKNSPLVLRRYEKAFIRNENEIVRSENEIKAKIGFLC